MISRCIWGPDAMLRSVHRVTPISAVSIDPLSIRLNARFIMFSIPCSINISCAYVFDPATLRRKVIPASCNTSFIWVSSNTSNTSNAVLTTHHIHSTYKESNQGQQTSYATNPTLKWLNDYLHILHNMGWFVVYLDLLIVPLISRFRRISWPITRASLSNTIFRMDVWFVRFPSITKRDWTTPLSFAWTW